ncbi:oxidoreductase [Endozoicomonas sp. OPT23]|uniref:SDR family NAD(P)-dependent oxidoreductase n=1 Tax=Endozoicomonas sp. OPT23 TaxID=2072845 RepID=UPI00129A491F|nr:SDR family NAD(P)-dependent oxidoreductase [Endozoicomonas sp. OPT23]MRI33107.1 oxidoreductase [Endozoicomonas sp. OPT23]
MAKTILITGATDGIGFETAKLLVTEGHHILLHGRSDKKLAKTKAELLKLDTNAQVETYKADLSLVSDVETLAKEISANHQKLDVLINNAGVYSIADPITEEGLDARFAVNTIAPYLLTKRLLPLMNAEGRVVNLSSAAQAPVDLHALAGRVRLNDGLAYAQSKLALTMWNNNLAKTIGSQGPVVVAVNPASMLGSKMVKEAYGVSGGDLRIGADILVRAALSDEFANASGKYFDNDSGRFASPHADALNDEKCAEVTHAIERVLK